MDKTRASPKLLPPSHNISISRFDQNQFWSILMARTANSKDAMSTYAEAVRGGAVLQEPHGTGVPALVGGMRPEEHLLQAAHTRRAVELQPGRRARVGADRKSVV